jgi:hypothetical protein
VSPGDLVRTGLLLLGAALLVVAGWRFQRVPDASEQAYALLNFLDRDGDARVDEAEFDRASDRELPFALLDLDQSGALEPWELDAVIRHLSPLRASLSWVPRAL